MCPDSSLAVCCSHKVSLRSSRWISWTRGKQAFSNATQGGRELRLGRNLSSHNIDLALLCPCCCILEWIIWFRLTYMSSYPLRLAWQPDVFTARLCPSDMVAWHLGVAWPALLVTEVFPPILIRCFRWLWRLGLDLALCRSSPSLTQAACVIVSREPCVLAWSGSPGEVRHVCEILFSFCSG